MAADLTAVLGADTSQLRSEIKSAKESLKGYKSEVDKLSGSNSNSTKAIDKARNAIHQQSQTYKGAKIQVKKLEESIRDLEWQYSHLGSKKGAFAAELGETMQAAKEKVKSLKQEIADFNGTVEKAASKSKGFKGFNLGEKLGKVGNLVGGKFGSIIGGLASKLANPWVAGGAAIAGYVAASMNAEKTMRQVTQITSEQGNAAVITASKMQSLSSTYGLDFSDTLRASNVMMKDFGKSSTEVGNLLSIAMAKGANASGDLLENLREYAPQFAANNLSLEQFIALSIKSQRLGIYNDKAFDAIKEFGLRVGDMNKSTKKALEDVNISWQEMQAVMESGDTSGAIQMILDKLIELGPESQKAKALITATMGAMGEDVGYTKLIPLLQSLLNETEDLLEPTTQYERDLVDLEKATNKWDTACNKLFNEDGAQFTHTWTRIKEEALEAGAAIMDEVASWFMTADKELIFKFNVEGEQKVESAMNKYNVSSTKARQEMSKMREAFGKLKSKAQQQQYLRDYIANVNKSAGASTNLTTKITGLNAAFVNGISSINDYIEALQLLQQLDYNNKTINELNKGYKWQRETSTHKSGKENPLFYEDLPEWMKVGRDFNFINGDAKHPKSLVYLLNKGAKDWNQKDNEAANKTIIDKRAALKQDNVEIQEKLNNLGKGKGEGKGKGTGEGKKTYKGETEYERLTNETNETLKSGSIMELYDLLKRVIKSFDLGKITEKQKLKLTDSISEATSSKAVDITNKISTNSATSAETKDLISYYEAQKEDTNDWNEIQKFNEALSYVREYLPRVKKETGETYIEQKKSLDTEAVSLELRSKDTPKYKNTVEDFAHNKPVSNAELVDYYTSISDWMQQIYDITKETKESNDAKIKEETDFQQKLIDANPTDKSKWDENALKQLAESEKRAATYTQNSTKAQEVLDANGHWIKFFGDRAKEYSEKADKEEQSGWSKQQRFRYQAVKSEEEWQEATSRTDKGRKKYTELKSKPEAELSLDDKTFIKDFEELQKKLPDLELKMVLNKKAADEVDEITQKHHKLGETLNNVGGAATQVGSAFSAMGEAFESKGLNIAGLIMGAVGNTLLAFGDALAKDQTTKSNIWAFLGASAVGIAQIAGVVSQIKAMGSYADGGIIQGASKVGDMNLARVNGGEMILNGSQQAKLFSLLNGNTSSPSSIKGGGNVSFEIKGQKLVGVLNNYNKRRSRL